MPIATLRTAVQQRLAGKRPSDGWRGSVAAHEAAVRALPAVAALVREGRSRQGARRRADQRRCSARRDDGLALDEYPIARRRAGDRAPCATRSSRPPSSSPTPTCCSPSAYASLGEDLLVGQVNPKTVGQSWHIDARDENVDSALVRTLTQDAARQVDERDAAVRSTGTRRCRRRWRAIASSSRRAAGSRSPTGRR